jgi:hypothetical protein
MRFRSRGASLVLSLGLVLTACGSDVSPSREPEAASLGAKEGCSGTAKQVFGSALAVKFDCELPESAEVLSIGLGHENGNMSGAVGSKAAAGWLIVPGISATSGSRSTRCRPVSPASMGQLNCPLPPQNGRSKGDGSKRRVAIVSIWWVPAADACRSNPRLLVYSASRVSSLGLTVREFEAPVDQCV